MCVHLCRPRGTAFYLHLPTPKGVGYLISSRKAGLVDCVAHAVRIDPACDAIQLERSFDLAEFPLQIVGCAFAVYRRDISALSGAAAKRSVEGFPCFAAR